MSDSILSAVSDSVFGVWFLIGAALVFFMQCGFAMVESGFTRAKNAGNIIMKNLMDFCIGAVMFILLGFGLMMGEECLGGLVGMPTLGVFTDYAHFDWSNFVFNLVFCATAATIVSGAMAERTKFSAYCIYSAVISAVVYPVEAGWIWNSDGWLVKLGFHDFAGSTAIHMVGGIAAFIGSAILGPRIGKYKIDKKTGEKKVRAIPGHNLPSAYADFMPAMAFATSASMRAALPETKEVTGAPIEPVERAVPVESYIIKNKPKLTKIVMVFSPARFEDVKEAMNDIGVTGMTVTNVMGCGVQKGHDIRKYRGVEIEEMNLNPKMKLEMVVSAVPVSDVVEAARRVLYTGNIGDGKIFIYEVDDVVKVRTGEHGYDALQGEDDI